MCFFWSEKLQDRVGQKFRSTGELCQLRLTSSFHMYEHTSTLTLAHTGTYTYSRRGTCIHLFYQVIFYYLIILFVNSTKIFPGLMQKYLSCVIDNLTTLFLKIESLDVLLLLLANLLFVKDNISIIVLKKENNPLGINTFIMFLFKI